MKYKKEIMIIIASSILSALIYRWVGLYMDKVSNKTGIPI